MSSVRYGKLEKPEKIKVEESSPTYARFIAEPFERGYGHTVGNGLRRVMLSSLEAPAIASFRMEGVSHEYMAVEGIVEDITNIILNLKGALLRQIVPEGETSSRGIRKLSKVLEVTTEDLKAGGGQKIFTLGDIIDTENFEIVNPDLPIFTATQPMSRRIDLRVAIGRGYAPTEVLDIGEKVVDEIAVDALFSPVRIVDYRVENTRVGQATDYDRLILEVKTDGRVTPQEALSFAAQLAVTQYGVFTEVEQRDIVFQKEETIVDSDREALVAKLALRIGDIELSVRSTNCLNGAGIRFIGELVTLKENDMLRFRNFGKKSLTEIREKLEELGLSFDMDLAGYGLSRENIATVLEEYIAEHGSEVPSGEEVSHEA